MRMDGTVLEGWPLRLCYSLVAHFSSSASASPPRAGTTLISSPSPSPAKRFSLLFHLSIHSSKILLCFFLFTSMSQLLLLLLLYLQYSKEQASRDPDNYFNIRYISHSLFFVTFLMLALLFGFLRCTVFVLCVFFFVCVDEREFQKYDTEIWCFCRMLTCPAAELVDGSKVLYFEQVSITMQVWKVTYL